MKLTIIILLIVVGGMLIYVDMLRRKINAIAKLSLKHAHILIKLGQELEL